MMDENKCQKCQEPMFEVFFNTDKMYTSVKYLRCIHCNIIDIEKRKNKDEQH